MDDYLNFFYGDSPGGTYFDTALAAQAFIHVHRFGFAVFDLENVGRAGVHAFTLAIAFVFVHGYLKHSFLFTSLFGFKTIFNPYVKIILRDFPGISHDPRHRVVIFDPGVLI
jgi:hypothetical protein